MKKKMTAEQIVELGFDSVMLSEEEPLIVYDENGNIEWVEPRYSIVTDIKIIL